MEFEMIALATASEETSWLRSLLAEIPLWERPISAVLIHCDSTAAIEKKLRIVITMVRNDRYVVSTTLLENYSQQELLEWITYALMII